jgi:hypothetical protein
MIGRYNDLIDFLAKYKIQQFENKHMNWYLSWMGIIKVD